MNKSLFWTARLVESEQILFQLRQILQSDAGNPAKNLTKDGIKFATHRQSGSPKTISKHKLSRIYLGSGCFWGKEYHLSRLDGVATTKVGFMGGHTAKPVYKEVCTKTTGHAEVVAVDYDEEQLSTHDLIHFFFSIHDPQIDRRGKGGQYRSVIFYTTAEQQKQAAAWLSELQRLGFTIFTELEAATDFWAADERHQRYCDLRGLNPKVNKGLLDSMKNTPELSYPGGD